MERVETRCGVPLETLGRGRAFAGMTAAACAGLLAGLTAAAALRGCGGATPHLDAVMTRDALEGNIRKGIYPENDWDAEPEAGSGQWRAAADGTLEFLTGNAKEAWVWRQ